MKHGLFLSVVFFLTILLFFPLKSYSQNDRPYSFNLKLGGYTTTGSLNDLEDEFGDKYKAGPCLELSFAHKIIPNFGMEYGVGILNTKIDDSKVGAYHIAQTYPHRTFLQQL